MFLLLFGFLRSFFSFASIRNWIAFLITHWKGTIVAAILGLFLYQMFSPWQFLFGLDTIPSLNKKLEQSIEKNALIQKQFDTCADANKKLSNAIGQQNQSIEKWRDLSNKIDSSTADLKKQIDDSRAKSKRDVQSILDAPTPPDCKAAIEYLRDTGAISWKEKQ